MSNDLHTWEIRNPDGGTPGLEFPKGRMGAHIEILRSWWNAEDGSQPAWAAGSHKERG